MVITLLPLFSLILSSEITLAVDSTSKANFELTGIKNGGFEVSASDVTFEQKTVHSTGVATTNQNNESTIRVNNFSGYANPWKLKVFISEFVGTSPTSKLFGAKITMPITKLSPVSNFDAGTITAIKPQVSAIELIPSTETVDNSRVYMEATQGKGYGEWLATFGNIDDKKPMSLSYEAGSSADSYVAKMTYSLEFTPEP
ncbi:WxL domain-containing protein [Vagococcus silagei]